MQDFHNLNVWKKSHLLTLNVYKVTKAFPKNEMFGITSQLRRATSSIPTNIAEGCGRGSDKDFARFTRISMGSANEAEYLLQLSLDLDYLNSDDYNKLIAEITSIKKMLNSLHKSLQKPSQEPGF
jgi:four helix bundle protein